MSFRKPRLNRSSRKLLEEWWHRLEPQVRAALSLGIVEREPLPRVADVVRLSVPATHRLIEEALALLESLCQSAGLRTPIRVDRDTLLAAFPPVRVSRRLLKRIRAGADRIQNERKRGRPVTECGGRLDD